VPVDMTAAIVFEGNREVATVGIFSDLRERMELEQKLSTAEERLEASEKNAVIVALAGTAAHELNQPLTSVMGYAELLKRRLKEDDFAWRPVDIIYREAERMAEIVRKIGKITRYETKSYVGAARILDLEKATSNED
jgi:signal transduction histidine kinase